MVQMMKWPRFQPSLLTFPSDHNTGDKVIAWHRQRSIFKEHDMEASLRQEAYIKPAAVTTAPTHIGTVKAPILQRFLQELSKGLGVSHISTMGLEFPAQIIFIREILCLYDELWLIGLFKNLYLFP